MGLRDLLDGDQRLLVVFVLAGQNLQPSEHRPHAVLLADVVAAGAEGLLAAEEGHVGLFAREVLLVARVHEVAEELPACRRDETRDLLLLGHQVEGSRCGHRPGATLEAIREEGDALGIGGDDRQAVRGAYEPLLAQDHVAVGIAIGGGTEFRQAIGGADPLARLVDAHRRGQFHSVGQVRVGVAVGRRAVASEVLQGDRVHEAFGVGAQLVYQDALGVGALHAVHGVVHEREVRACDELLDGLEVEDLAEQGHVIVGTVKHVHTDLVVDHVAAGPLDVDVGEPCANLVLADRFGVGEDGLCDLLRGRAAVLAVELDAEVLVQAARVVRGGQDETAEGHEAALAVPNDGTCRRGAQQAVIADPDVLHAIPHRHLDDDLDGLVVPVAAIATHHQRATLEADAIRLEGIEGALHEVLQVVFLHEDLRLLAEAGGAGLLALDGCRLLTRDRDAAGHGGHRRLALQHDGHVRSALGGAGDGGELRPNGGDHGDVLLLERARSLHGGVDRVPEGGERHGVDGRLRGLAILLGQALQEVLGRACVERRRLLRGELELHR
mmetsp:Transcript_12216/g.32856  ORF Transcript_12216/g.32856 Transcript_12216/m.32856 type:complete len:553 (+) Transcript_12216:728-2386(+)